MKTQVQLYRDAEEKIAAANIHFMDMVNDPINPLTNDDLAKLVERFPQRWERFSSYIGKLPN